MGSFRIFFSRFVVGFVWCGCVLSREVAAVLGGSRDSVFGILGSFGIFRFGRGPPGGIGFVWHFLFPGSLRGFRWGDCALSREARPPWVARERPYLDFGFVWYFPFWRRAAGRNWVRLAFSLSGLLAGLPLGRLCSVPGGAAALGSSRAAVLGFWVRLVFSVLEAGRRVELGSFRIFFFQNLFRIFPMPGSARFCLVGRSGGKHATDTRIGHDFAGPGMRCFGFSYLVGERLCDWWGRGLRALAATPHHRDGFDKILRRFNHQRRLLQEAMAALMISAFWHTL